MTASNHRSPLLAVARGACAVALVIGSTSAWGARAFPQNSVQVKITDVADDRIVADGRPLHLSPGVRIFTTGNTTLVRSALPAPVIARIQVDLNGDVRQIWLLADDEILVPPWWQFWKREQPN